MEAAPELLNNIGLIHEALGQYGDAARAYEKVVTDPAASPELRALDAARLAAVQPRLGKAWVIARSHPAGTTLLVDGEAPNGPVGEAFSVAPGAHTFELRAPHDGDVYVVRGSFPLDRRTEVTFDLTELVDGGARLDIGELVTRLDTIWIDDARITRPVESLSGVVLAAGDHRVRVRWLDGSLSRGTVSAFAGHPLRLRDVVGAGPSPSEPLEPDDPPELEPPRRGGELSPWPWVVAATGAGGVAAGAVLLAEADSTFAAIVSAERDANGVITGMTARYAHERVEVGRLQRSLGIGLLAGGAALAIGGTVWGIVDMGTREAQTDQHIDVTFGVNPGGVSVSGRW